MKTVGGKNVITAGTDVDTVLTDEQVVEIIKNFLGEAGVDPVVAAEICTYLSGLGAGTATVATKIITADCETITVQEILDLVDDCCPTISVDGVAITPTIDPVTGQPNFDLPKDCCPTISIDGVQVTPTIDPVTGQPNFELPKDCCATISIDGVALTPTIDPVTGQPNFDLPKECCPTVSVNGVPVTATTDATTGQPNYNVLTPTVSQGGTAITPTIDPVTGQPNFDLPNDCCPTVSVGGTPVVPVNDPVTGQPNYDITVGGSGNTSSYTTAPNEDGTTTYTFNNGTGLNGATDVATLCVGAKFLDEDGRNLVVDCNGITLHRSLHIGNLHTGSVGPSDIGVSNMDSAQTPINGVTTMHTISVVSGTNLSATAVNTAAIAGIGNLASGSESATLGGNSATASGRNAVALGSQSSTAAGISSAVVAAFNGTNTGNFAIVGGSGVTNSGRSSFVSGEGSSNTGARALVGGFQPVNTGFQGLVRGQSGLNSGTNAWVGGNNADNTGNDALVNGQNNTNTAPRTSVNGFGNTVSGANNQVAGETNTVTNGANNTVVGFSNNLSVFAGQTADNNLIGGRDGDLQVENTIVNGAGTTAIASRYLISGGGAGTDRNDIANAAGNGAAIAGMAVGRGILIRNDFNAFAIGEDLSIFGGNEIFVMGAGASPVDKLENGEASSMVIGFGTSEEGIYIGRVTGPVGRNALNRFGINSRGVDFGAGSVMNIQGLPTSAAGLNPGDLYRLGNSLEIV